MGQLAVPMMIGAAVGGGAKLLQGKGVGGILKGAALGGALGGATGGMSNLLGGATATATEATPSLLPEALAGTIESSPELVMGADGVLRNPAYFSNVFGSPVYTGNGMVGGMLDAMPSGMSIDNLQGAAQMASMYQPTQGSPAPSGRIEVGQAPSPEGLAQFIQQYYPKYQRPRNIDLGLIG